MLYHSYQELKEISKLIDCYAFLKHNRSDFDYMPYTPLYSTDYPSVETQDKTDRIDKTIKDFCNTSTMPNEIPK